LAGFLLKTWLAYCTTVKESAILARVELFILRAKTIRLIRGRLHDLVLAPNDSKGRTLDLDTVAHEHHSFFFPANGHGAANAAGFGWRNGG
jgi:hypothetical protein